MPLDFIVLYTTTHAVTTSPFSSWTFSPPPPPTPQEIFDLGANAALTVNFGRIPNSNTLLPQEPPLTPLSPLLSIQLLN